MFHEDVLTQGSEIEHHVRTNMPENSQSAVELVAPMSRVATKALAVFFCLPHAPTVSNEDEKILTGDEILLPMSKITRRVAKNLDSSLAGLLPKYMIPQLYIPLTRMPFTSAGKMDRTRLRNIVAALPKESTPPYRLVDTETKAAGSYIPKTDTEQKILRLWEEIMNVDLGSVSTDDNFFKFGG
jgi:hypothetical protein